MAAIRVAIAGATGYAGEELLRLLLRHPEVQLTYLAASAKWERPVSVSEVYPRFAAHVDLPVEALDSARLAQACELAFLALPHGTAMELAPRLLASGKRIIDLSGDFRLRDASLYPQWYRMPHTHPELLTSEGVVYGLTEFHRDEIRSARLVANPGCYATSVLLGCMPLFARNLIEDDLLQVDAKSGLSGAGRKADPTLLFTEMAENLCAYKVNEHPHMPEIVQEVQRLTGRAPRLTFVPQVIPATRGLISMLYARVRATTETIRQAYEAMYPRARTPFVRLQPTGLPQLRDVTLTNDCVIGLVHQGAMGVLTVAGALDNLMKGAAGGAVQNFNVMLGLPETTALR